jgi:hypothetical protein
LSYSCIPAAIFSKKISAALLSYAERIIIKKELGPNLQKSEWPIFPLALTEERRLPLMKEV